MNKKSLLAAAALLLGLSGSAQWQPAGDKIKTPWAEKVDPACPLNEYPRPLAERARWKNLNGLWNYSIVPAGTPAEAYDGQILVPFAVESSLSGVGKRLGAENELWYARTFVVPTDWSGDRILLHFGAVDWKADSLGQRRAGRQPHGRLCSVHVRRDGSAAQERRKHAESPVWDPDRARRAAARQADVAPGGIWYTPVSGIWQTVWLEPVPQRYIAGCGRRPTSTAARCASKPTCPMRGRTTGSK